MKLARNMGQFKTPGEMKHLIRHFYTTLDFGESTIKSLAALIADASNCIAVLTSQKLNDDDLPETEYWYRFKYDL